MDSRIRYRLDGYDKGFVDGKRTGGKLKKTYIDNFFKEETQSLSSDDSSEFIEGWYEGFADAVRKSLNMVVKQEDILAGHILELD
jgi:hypothetical protein